MDTVVVLIVLSTATLHASWNFATRKSEGSLPAIWLSLLLARCLILPLAAQKMHQSFIRTVSLFYMSATAIIHALYFSLLSKAYQGGDISLVYPIARGTGVAGTAVLVLLLAIEGIKPQAAAGIIAVCAGVFLVGLGHRALRDRHSKPLSIVLALLIGLTVVGYNLIDKLAVSKGQAGAAQPGELHPLVYICAVFLGSSLLMTPYVLVSARAQVVEAWRTQKKYIALIGPVALCTYLPILFAYQWEKASSIVAFREFSVVIVSILGITFLREKITGPKAVGIGLVTAGLILIKWA